MSRGPGALQRSILEILTGEPGNRMWWPKLKRRFPVEVRNKTFYRAVRGLRRMGRVQLYEDSGLLYLERKPYYTVGEKIMISDAELKELLALLPRQERTALVTEVARGYQEHLESMVKVR